MKFWIDFSGYVCVEAKSAEEAERLFWERFVKDVAEPFSDDVWDIDGVEEKVEFSPSTSVDVEAFAKDFEDA